MDYREIAVKYTALVVKLTAISVDISMLVTLQARRTCYASLCAP
jgi:hypothetical protein